MQSETTITTQPDQAADRPWWIKLVFLIGLAAAPFAVIFHSAYLWGFFFGCLISGGTGNAIGDMAPDIRDRLQDWTRRRFKLATALLLIAMITAAVFAR